MMIELRTVDDDEKDDNDDSDEDCREGCGGGTHGWPSSATSTSLPEPAVANTRISTKHKHKQWRKHQQLCFNISCCTNS